MKRMLLLDVLSSLECRLVVRPKMGAVVIASLLAAISLSGFADDTGGNGVAPKQHVVSPSVSNQVNKLEYIGDFYERVFLSFYYKEDPDGTCYLHRGSPYVSRVIIQQTVPGGVIVTVNPAVRTGQETRTAVFVQTAQKYIDGDALSPNVLVADGTYEYTTVLGVRRKIRKYNELDPEVTKELLWRLDEKERVRRRKIELAEELAKRQWHDEQERIKTNLFQAVASVIGTDSFDVEHSIYAPSNLLSNIESIRIVNMDSFKNRRPGCENMGYKELRQAQINKDWKMVFEILWYGYQLSHEFNSNGFSEDATNMVVNPLIRIPTVRQYLEGVFYPEIVLEIKLKRKLADGHKLKLVLCSPPGYHGEFYEGVNDIEEHASKRGVSVKLGEFADVVYRGKMNQIEAGDFLVFGGILFDVVPNVQNDDEKQLSSVVNAYQNAKQTACGNENMMTMEERENLRNEVLPRIFYQYLDKIKKHYRCFGDFSGTNEEQDGKQDNAIQTQKTPSVENDDSAQEDVQAVKAKLAQEVEAEKMRIQNERMQLEKELEIARLKAEQQKQLEELAEQKRRDEEELKPKLQEARKVFAASLLKSIDFNPKHHYVVQRSIKGMVSEIKVADESWNKLLELQKNEDWLGMLSCIDDGEYDEYPKEGVIDGIVKGYLEKDFMVTFKAPVKYGFPIVECWGASGGDYENNRTVMGTFIPQEVGQSSTNNGNVFRIKVPCLKVKLFFYRTDQGAIYRIGDFLRQIGRGESDITPEVLEKYEEWLGGK